MRLNGREGVTGVSGRLPTAGGYHGRTARLRRVPAAPVPVTVKREGLYLPFGERDQALFPGLNGGANCGGASFDPGSRLLT